MRTTKMTLAAILAVCWGGALLAGPINSNRPLQPLGDNGTELTLQEVFDSIKVSGPGIDAVADQTNYALFTNTASSGSVATFIIEIAGYAGTNTFGIYEAGSPTNRAQIFSGPGQPGDQALVSFMANGDIKVNNQVVATGFGRAFGFYLAGTGGTFYSEDSLNGGSPQALIYQGDNKTELQLHSSLQSGVFTPNEFIIAFEDLPFASSDKDFQDLVVLVESVKPVPEPASLLLLGTGLLGAGLIKRRRNRA